MSEPSKNVECIAVADARNLVSQAWRLSDENKLPACGFTIMHENEAIPAARMFHTNELPGLLCLIRVVAQELMHDGGFTPDIKVKLARLVTNLEGLQIRDASSWEDSDG